MLKLSPPIVTIGTLVFSVSFALPNKAIGNTITAQFNCSIINSNEGFKQCARVAYEQADRRLNQVYQQLVSKLNSDERQELTNAQLAWIQFRDKNCSFEVYPSRSGTGYLGYLNSCLERMTKERTTELQKALQQQR